jgi:hypothetical protein
MPVLLAAAVVAVALTATSQRYDYEGDPLYFPLLRPAWGVRRPAAPRALGRGTDQATGRPALATRLPSTVAVTAAVVVVPLVTRELSGCRQARSIAASAFTGSAAVAIFGPVLLTSTLELLTCPWSACS